MSGRVTDAGGFSSHTNKAGREGEVDPRLFMRKSRAGAPELFIYFGRGADAQGESKVEAL